VNCAEGGNVTSEVWDVPALVEWVQRERAGDLKTVELLGSLSRSSRIFRYHMVLARDAFKDFKDDDHLKMTVGMFGADEDEGVAFENAKLVSEANLIASINVVRNSYDIFAQVVNSLVLDNPFKVHDCNIHGVCRTLAPSELKTTLERVVSSGWYYYLSDFTNTIKHRQLLKHDPSISFVENISGGKIERFTYERPIQPSAKSKTSNRFGEHRSHPSYWVRDVLQGAVEVHNEIRACGQFVSRMLMVP